MAFLLFGPFADEKDRLDLICIGGHHEDRTKLSRCGIKEKTS
jgi:hypothetical protein